MAKASFTGRTISRIYTFACSPVHAAWVDELTTPIATWIAFVEFGDGQLIKVEPREVDVDPARYPSLGIVAEVSDRSALEFEAYGKTHRAQPLDAAAHVLPFEVLRTDESDPLKEGAVSELKMIGREQSIIFRHIFPPMTLGIAFQDGCGAPGSIDSAHE